jgi:hypothetical protein
VLAIKLLVAIAAVKASTNLIVFVVNGFSRMCVSRSLRGLSESAFNSASPPDVVLVEAEVKAGPDRYDT